MSHTNRSFATFLGPAMVASALAAPLGGCAVLSRSHLDELADGGASMDAQTTPDTGTGTDSGPDDSIPLVPCGNASAHLFADSTGGQLRVDTTALSNRNSSCGSREAPGNDGFIAIDVLGSEQWHFHVIPDPSVAGQDRDPFIYLLDSTCRNTDCSFSSDQCRGPGDEHFAFVAPSDGRFYLGIDDRNPGGGVYLIEAIKLACGDGMRVHGEACDGTTTCNSACREILSDTRPTEQIPDDNEIEGNFVQMPASNEIIISGTIGGDLCVYPDVFNFSVPAGLTNLQVDVLKTDMTVCDNGSYTPYEIVLKSPGGGVRAAAQTNATSGCAELRVSGLSAANYFIYVQHAEPLDRPYNYSLRIRLTP